MRRIVLTLIIAAIAVYCHAAAEPNDINELVKGNNTFALNLYSQLCAEPGNLFLSPYSISTALAMTYTGAGGQTEKQMAGVLAVPLISDAACAGIVTAPWPQERYHPAFGGVIERLNAQGQKGNYELVVANALWGQKDYDFLDNFIALIERNYKGGLNEVDFVTATESARKKINNWVEQRTREKIKELIQKGVLNRDTRLVLTNAIYFKGKWAKPFNKSMTTNETFYLTDGGETRVAMMRQIERLRYARGDGFEVLELPYVENELSMLVLLPARGVKITDFEQKINADSLSKWLKMLNRKRVDAHLPRFTMTWQKELAPVLKSMGMSDAFSNAADFSGMTGNRELFISNVVHKAFVEVNEEGTEAAAATGVAIGMTSARPDKPVVFKADRPFVFIIKDNATGSILFVGRLSEIAAGRQ